MAVDRQDPNRHFARIIGGAFAVVILVLLGVLVAIGQGWIDH